MAKAQSQYISWIIVLALVVGISFVLYQWSLSQAERTSEQIQSRSDPVVCSQVGVSIDGICQTFRSVDMNVSNTNNLVIQGFQIHTVGLYPDEPNYLDTIEVTDKVEPYDTEYITVLKEGTLAQVEIVPFVTRNNKRIYCEEVSVTFDQDYLKQC